MTSSEFNREQGAVMVLALGFTMIVGTLLVGAITTTTLLSRSTRSNLDSTVAQGLAEGATEVAQKEMLTAIANFEDPPLAGSITLGGITANWTATQLGAATLRTEADGTQTIGTPYEISSSVTVESGSGNVNRIVDLTVTPLYQYMIFYDGDLEVLPGPTMYLEGRVHANGDLYLGAGQSLVVDTDYMRATGEIKRQRKNNGRQTGGTVSVRKYNDTTFVSLAATEDSDSANWAQTALARWDGTVQSGAHSVREVLTPELQSIEPGGHFHQNADLVIRDGAAFNNFGVPLYLPPGTIQEMSMYDARQETYVTVTEIDMALLNTSGSFPANGLVYAYRTDASTSQPNGFRLTNGSELLSDFSLVSENSVYIHGDFNNVNKKGASVIADAVNLLSNAWDDSKTPGNVPKAAETEYHLAFITGDIPTPDGGGRYSGGFENLPRFHENWRGVRATIRGAFARLYESKYATGHWGKRHVYSPPIRDWRFDADLLDVANLPPFTPNTAYVRRLLWDDHHEVTFKPDDLVLSTMPDAPTYDPWVYDVGFMSKVISDPNTNSMRKGYNPAGAHSFSPSGFGPAPTTP